MVMIRIQVQQQLPTKLTYMAEMIPKKLWRKMRRTEKKAKRVHKKKKKKRSRQLEIKLLQAVVEEVRSLSLGISLIQELSPWSRLRKCLVFHIQTGILLMFLSLMNTERFSNQPQLSRSRNSCHLLLPRV